MTLVSVNSEQRDQILAQIGRMRILSISGGRVTPIDAGIELPVSAGYVVRVELDGSDTYVVSRVFKRACNEWLKGVRDRVYADEVGEAAYYAGMYVSHNENDWMTAR
jgi:hypothetical protein